MNFFSLPIFSLSGKIDIQTNYLLLFMTQRSKLWIKFCVYDHYEACQENAFRCKIQNICLSIHYLDLRFWLIAKCVICCLQEMLVPGSGNQTESDLDTANTDLNSDPIHNKVKQLLKATAKCRSRFTLIDECYIIELFLFLFLSFG